jgi:sec-independent protein translocase protein TatB
MFNIGGGELIVIMLLALIVLGPKRLPDAARQIGKAMADLRRLSSGFQNEIRSAIDGVDDPDRITARRNVLAKEDPSGGTAAPSEAPSHPPRTEPLVAGPGLEPRPNAPAEPEPTRPPSAQARAAARKQGAASPAAGEKPAAAGDATKEAGTKNGTPVKKPKPSTEGSSTAAPPGAKD